MAHADYPKRLYFDGKPAIRVFSAEEEASVLAAREPDEPETDEAVAVRAKLADLNVPAPHHRTGLDKLKALLAEAEAAAAAQQ